MKRPELFMRLTDAGKRQLHAVRKRLANLTLSGSRGDHDFLPAALEVMEKPASPAGRSISLAIMAFSTITILWMTLSEMDIVVSAQGRIVPSGRVKTIQSPDAGVVKAIHVRDGQRVRRGDILIELDSTSTGADRERLEREIIEAEIEFARLKAQYQGKTDFTVPVATVEADVIATQKSLLASRLVERDRKLATLDSDIKRRSADRDAIRSEVERLQKTLPLLVRRMKKKRRLARKGYVTDVELIDARLEVINTRKELEIQQYRLKEAEAGLAAATSQRQRAEAEFEANTLADLAEVAKRRDAARQELIKARQRESFQALRSPVDGIVQQLAVNTIGGVVTAAQQLLIIVPDNIGLEVEAQVQNKDIGFIEAGQETRVKVETYEFTRHGALTGTIQWVGNDAILDERLGPVYPVRITLRDKAMPNIVNGKRGKLMPGMLVTSDINIGKRRVIDYFLAPIIRHKEESLRER